MTITDVMMIPNLPVEIAAPNDVVFPLIKETYVFHRISPVASIYPAIKAKNIANLSCILIESDETEGFVLMTELSIISRDLILILFLRLNEDFLRREFFNFTFF